jgi:integrase
MAVRKIKTSWWVDFMFNHARYRKRSPENSRSGSLAYEIVLRQKLARGEPIRKWPEIEEPTFEEFASKWLEEYVRSNNKFSEQRNRTYVLQSSIIPFFGKLRLTEITTRIIEQYKGKKLTEGLQNKTIRNHLTLLNRCIATGYEWLELQGTPPKINWPKAAPTEMDFLSFGECEALVSAATGIDEDLILTAVRTGMRQGELKGLQWSSIDWQNRTLAVRHSKDDHLEKLVPPKSNRVRYIPIDTDVYEALYRRRQNRGYVFLDVNERPFDHRSITRRLRKACANAQLRKIGWHTLRHTFASHLVMRGVPLTAVKELMGHASITTTMRYAHLAQSTLRTAIDLLNPKTILDRDFGQPVVNQWLRTQRDEIITESAHSKAARV